MARTGFLGWSLRSGCDEECDPAAFVQQFADGIPSPVFYKDASGAYRVCNKAYERLVGLSRREILGKGTRDIFPPQEAAEHERYDQALWVSGHVQSYDRPFKATDGSERRGLCRKSLITDDDGKPVGLIGIVTDITDLMGTQVALRRREEWFRALTEQALDLTVVIDAEAVIRFASPSVERILGWTPVQLIGGSLFVYVHPEDASTMREAIARNVNGKPGQERLVELRFRGRDESWRTLEVIGHNRLGDPAVRGIVVNARDVTERRSAQQKLLENEKRFRSVVENMPGLLAAASADFVPLAWNGECERVTGWRADEIVGNRSALRRLIPDKSVRDKLRQRYRTEGPDFREFEVDLHCRDGRVRTISWSSLSGRFPILGWPVWGIGRDVTEEKQARQAIAVASRMTATRILAAGTARHIENLVRVTSGNAALLSASVRDADAKASLTEILRTAEKAGRLSQQLLAYAEHRRAVPRPVDVNQAVREAVDFDGVSDLRHEISIELDLDSHASPVRADPSQITQIVAYLLANAGESISGAGKVVIRTRAVSLGEPDETTPSNLKPGTYVRLSVEDTGCGMDGQTAKRIFEPFFSTKADGLGLGLPGVYGIVRSLEGAITVDSREGSGSTFTVYLPAPAEARMISKPVPPPADVPDLQTEPSGALAAYKKAG